MRSVKIYGTVLCFLLASAALAGVRTDYDHSARFSQYHTFAWKASGARPNQWVDNSLMQGRVQDAVNRQLFRKGMREDNKTPDVYMSYRFNARDMRYVPGWRGGGWGRWGWYGRDAYLDRYTEGRLMINMVDAKTNRMVWQAYCTNTGNDPLDVRSAKKVEKLVADAFKHFPPAEKG